MLHRAAIACFALACVATFVTALPFPEMRIPTAVLLAIAAGLIAGLFVRPILPFASGAALIVAALSLAAVLLSLLAGTIGGSFHIDEPAQPVLWSLAGVAMSGLLLRIVPTHPPEVLDSTG